MSEDQPDVLLRKADHDEAALRALISGGPELTDAIGFHAQQAVEKRIKAVLADRAIPFPYTHDLVGLQQLARRAGIDVPARREQLALLTPWAVAVRYHDQQFDEPVDRSALVALVEDVGAWTRAELGRG